VRIGRFADNDVVLTDDGKAVSRHHAELRYENGVYVIRDLKSQNGTWIDAKRITHAVFGIGQHIAIGPYRLEMRPDEAPDEADEEAAEEAAPAEAPDEAVSFSDDEGLERPHQGSATAVKAAVVPAHPRRAVPSFDVLPWLKAQSQPRIYGALGALVLGVVIIAALLAREAPQSPPPETLVIEPPPARDETAERLAAAQQLFDAEEFDSAIKNHLEPILEKDPANVLAASLWTKAQIAIAPKPTPAPPTVNRPPGPRPPPIEAVQGIPILDGDDAGGYSHRVNQVLELYGQAETLMAQENWSEAAQAFEALATRYPEYRDARGQAARARDRIAQAAQAAMDEGRKLEEGGQLQAAVTAYDRALGLGTAEAAQSIARVRATASAQADQALRDARNYENRDRINDAVKRYERVLELLPPSDTRRQQAEAALRKLRPDDRR
jgi:predicted component of type VI protein secretion system